MTFLNPERLWLLVGVAALAVAYVGVLRWRRATTMRFTQVELLDRIVPQRPSWHRHVVATLQVLGLAAGVVAIARPVDTVTERIGSEGRIMLLFDVSSSMSASDVSPSRLAAAQQAAKAFIDQVDSTVEVGLITFSGGVSLDVRPTLERDPLTSAIDDIQLSDATAIGDALSAGTQVLVSLAGNSGPPTTDATGAPTGPPPGAIVLLSDGETTVGRPTAVGAQEAAAAGIPVFTIAFGTPGGSIVDPTTGESIAVPVQPDALSEVATATGGQAYEAASEAELADVYQRIQNVLGATLGEPVERVIEDTWKWAAAATALLAAGWALSLWWLRGMV